MSPKAKAPSKSAEEKAAEKATKAREKQITDYLKAAKQGDLGKIETALASGVDIDHQNEKGQTAAHYAAAFGHRKLLQCLHAKGANFGLQTFDDHKFTPLSAAQFVGESDTAKLIEELLAGKVMDAIQDSDDDDDDDDDNGNSDDAGSRSGAGASASGQLVSVSDKGRRRRQMQPHEPPAPTPATGDGKPSATATPCLHRDLSGLIVEQSDHIDKSESDPRLYRWLRLSNEMQVMLVSDPQSDYAAAAMDVAVGSASDPDAFPGLAHFVEHMLFLGTQKYPSEDEYTTYLEQHGGESNAFTAHEGTHYYFDVQHHALGGALDRFAQFFVEPLFTEDATDRELKAVDSEFERNRQQDAWRVQQLTKASADPRHPWARFNAGNLATLGRGGGALRDALIDFYGAHYSANRMSLAVLGRESLEELAHLVVPLFSAVRNQAPPPLVWAHPPYPDACLRRHFRVVPVKDRSCLTLTWAIPPIRQQYLSKPFRYVSHVLGHEGQGSLLSLLKSKGWAEELVAGETQSHSDFATFVVTITLTDAGNGHVDEMLPLIFSCLAMLRNAAPPRWIFDEIGGVSRMRLRFCDTIEPAQAVLSLSQTLGQRVVLPKHALVASFLYDLWAPDEIETLLAQLTPDRAILFHISPVHASIATQVEPFYGTSYSVTAMSETLLAACRTPPSPVELRFPDPNVFVPTDFELVCDRMAPASPMIAAASETPMAGTAAPSVDGQLPTVLATALVARGKTMAPVLLCDRPNAEVWHKVDKTFRRPKTNFYVDVIAPTCYASPGEAILTAIVFRLISDDLTEYAYPAELAGLTYMVKRHTTGFYLVTEGHSHRLPLLFAKVLERVTAPSCDAKRFGVQREQELKSIRGWFRSQPKEHARYAAMHLLDRQRWHVLEYFDFAVDDPACSWHGLLEHQKKLVSQIRLAAFCHGNTDASTALKMVDDAVAALGGAALTPEQLPDPRCLQLPAGVNLILRTHPSLYTREHAQCLNDDETNSAVEVILQAEPDQSPATQIVELLCGILANHAFETLRTNEQLGYLVDLGVFHLHGVHGLRVQIQSAAYGPEYLEERIEAFLDTCTARLSALSSETFSNHRDALVKMRLEPPKTLRDESSLYWSEITNGTYDFHRDEAACRCMASLTKQDLVHYWEEFFAPAARKRRKLASHAYAPSRNLPPRCEQGVEGRRVVYIDGFQDALAFKSTLSPYPPPPRKDKGGVAPSPQELS